MKKVSVLTKLPDRQFESLRKIQGYTFIFSELSKNIGSPGIFLIDTEYPKDELKNIPFNTWSCYFPIEKLKNDVINENLPALYETLTKDQTIFTKHYDFVNETFLPTEYGNFTMFGFRGRTNGKTILGLRTETLPDIVSVRTHSMCYTGDIFHSLKCDCREELEHALEYIQEKQGIFIYALEEGRGIGVLNKLAVYNSQHDGYDTVDAQYINRHPNDLRNYDYLRDVLDHYNVSSVDVITNNPQKVLAFQLAGIHINDTIKLDSTVNEYNKNYLMTKMKKNGHNFNNELGVKNHARSRSEV